MDREVFSRTEANTKFFSLLGTHTSEWEKVNWEKEAKKEHLERFRADWKAWVIEGANKDISLDFSGVEFTLDDERWKLLVDREDESPYFDFSDFFFGEAYFMAATFAGKTNFMAATFTGEAAFQYAKFAGDAYFQSATFTGKADFRGATFSGKAYFGDATFEEDADFWGATFEEDAYFGSATFTRDANFDEAIFVGDADFRCAKFEGDASFRRATFTGNAYFMDATFTGEAAFNNATFTGDAYFWDAKFEGDVNFGNNEFGKRKPFDISNKQKMKDSLPPIKVRDEFDAGAWAREFLRMSEANPGIPKCEDTMTAWFAQAIMAGYDYAKNSLELNNTEELF